MIGGVLTLAERSVASIMTPRHQISWVDLEDDLEKIRAKELIDSLDDSEALQQLLKRQRPIFIFEKMKVIDVINTLRSSKGSLVLVSNEFGNVQGLITPLDVFEAIAGEFPDADEQPDLVKLDESTWKASGMLDLYQLELELGVLDLVEEDTGYITVAGLILDKAQTEVKTGTFIEYQGVQFEVLDMMIT